MYSRSNIGNDIRLEQIQEQILRFSLMDFGFRSSLSDKGDEIDAIIVGLNTLGEELEFNK